LKKKCKRGRRKKKGEICNGLWEKEEGGSPLGGGEACWLPAPTRKKKKKKKGNAKHRTPKERKARESDPSMKGGLYRVRVKGGKKKKKDLITRGPARGCAKKRLTHRTYKKMKKEGR